MAAFQTQLYASAEAAGIRAVYAFEGKDGRRELHGADPPAFTVVAATCDEARRIFDADLYTVADAYIHGEIGVRGDLFAAIRHKEARPGTGGPGHWLRAALSRLSDLRPETWAQSRRRAAANIRFHYDRSNEFFSQFLDSRLVYSCAYYREPGRSLDDAQRDKLDYLCRKLGLKPGERFLDIGCGWGALVLHAALHYGVKATGCTLSQHQYEFARSAIARHGLGEKVHVHDTDYRDLPGRYEKIASVGMFEHVGRRRLRGYLRRVCGMLDDHGLFLNHGIVRPRGEHETVESLVWRRRVFPGGDLVRLDDVIREAGEAGFEVLDVENLRTHYALTCRAWVERLREREQACLRFVDPETYRTWVLWLAGSALNFEDGHLDVCQVLMARRASPYGRRLTRDHMRV